MASMKRLPALVFALAFAIAFAPVSVAMANANVGVIEVKVFEFGGVQAMAGVSVQLVNVETATAVASAVTDENGNAQFPQLALGLYQVRASLAGYTDAASPLMPLVENLPTSNVILELQEGEQEEGDDDEAAAAAAAGGFTFLGLSGGAAIAALVGIVAAAGLTAYGISEAAGDSTP